MAGTPEFDWTGLECCRFELARPLLVVRGSRGVLACSYLNVDTCNRLGEAAAIVQGVADFPHMLSASVVAVSDAARALGVDAGMSGREALAVFR